MTDTKPRLTQCSDLIYDVGLHRGTDSAFYLRKGFRVVGIEASPGLVDLAREQFREEIVDGRLTLIPAAIAPEAGRIPFYLNLDKDVWGTISPDFASRNERLGTRNEAVEVEAVTFRSVLEQHGIPYYLKVDIEGADTLCLEALHEFPERPRFVSVEIDLTCFAEGFDCLVHLWNLGYREFKVVNQSLNKRVQCPDPPLEGVYVPASFGAECSGPFGEEAPGRWLSIEETLQRCLSVMRQQQLFGASGGKYYDTWLRHPVKWFRRLAGMEPIGWYDLHAKFS